MRHSDDQPTISLPATEPGDTADQAALGEWFPGARDVPAEVATGAGGDQVNEERPPDEGLQRDEQLLAAAPSTVSPDELEAALSAPPPSARSLRMTKVLGVALVVALGFVGGVALGQRTGTADTGGVPGGAAFARGSGQFAGGFPGAGGGRATNGSGGGAAAGSGAGSGSGTAAGSDASGGAGASGASAQTTTTGTVKLIDGSVIYLTDADGNLTRVLVGDDTDVVRTRQAELGDIETGDSVTVTGTASADGVAASNVAVTR